MNGREVLDTVLEKLTAIDQRILSIDQKVSDIDQKVSDIDQRVSKLEQKTISIEQNMATKDQIVQLENKIERLANEGQADIMAILKLMDSKLDNTASRNDIAYIEDIFDVLATRTTRQEAEIRSLKKAK